MHKWFTGKENELFTVVKSSTEEENELFIIEYKEVEKVVFLIDPPYLSTFSRIERQIKQCLNVVL